MKLYSRKELCEAAGIHPTTSGKHIVERYGITPYSYINNSPVFVAKDVATVKELRGKHRKKEGTSPAAPVLSIVQSSFTEEDRQMLRETLAAVTVLCNALMGPTSK